VSSTYRAIDTFEEKGAGGVASLPWYTADMTNPMSVTQFARLGGKARAAKLTKEQLSAIGKKGGRPRKILGESPVMPDISMQSRASTKQPSSRQNNGR
jgi:hypothetical protein